MVSILDSTILQKLKNMNLGFLPKRHQPQREICMSSSVTSERSGVTGSVLPGITGTSPAMNASRMEIRDKPIRRCQSVVHVRYKDEHHHDERNIKHSWIQSPPPSQESKNDKNDLRNIKHNNWIPSPPPSQESKNDKKSDYKVSFKFISVPQPKKIINDSRKQLLAMSDDKSKKVLEGKLDKSQGEFVGRSGLTYQTPDSLTGKQQDSSNKKAFAKSYINEIAKEAIFTDRKRNELLKLWPQIFYELVYGSVTEMSDLQTYMKRCMEDLEKS